MTLEHLTLFLQDEFTRHLRRRLARTQGLTYSGRLPLRKPESAFARLGDLVSQLDVE